MRCADYDTTTYCGSSTAEVPIPIDASLLGEQQVGLQYTATRARSCMPWSSISIDVPSHWAEPLTRSTCCLPHPPVCLHAFINCRSTLPAPLGRRLRCLQALVSQPQISLCLSPPTPRVGVPAATVRDRCIVRIVHWACCRAHNRLVHAVLAM